LCWRTCVSLEPTTRLINQLLLDLTLHCTFTRLLLLYLLTVTK
jgi:hypothetical protein